MVFVMVFKIDVTLVYKCSDGSVSPSTSICLKTLNMWDNCIGGTITNGSLEAAHGHFQSE